MLSAHTSPLDPPGRGDAGGMNVYVLELSRRLGEAGVEVEVFTRADRPGLPESVEAAPGVTVRHVAAGPYGRLTKADLPAQLCAFTRDVLRVEAAHPGGWYDLVHSHYWLSGQVGSVVADRWGVPLVHSMHTMAKVKNAALAAGDVAEPVGRVVGEEQVVAAADRLVANTEVEAAALVRHYAADPDRVAVVHPGVDLDVFRPGDTAAARRELDVAPDAHLLLFAGRVQPLKAPDVLVRAVGELLVVRPDLRDRLVVAVVGGPSGTGLDRPDALADLTAALGLGDVVRLVPPVDHATLARWYSAATVVVVPSYSESFGLVALEAQACGTPVVAAAVGGLVTAVRDGVSGVLVDGHDPVDYAAAIVGLLDDPGRRARMGHAAVQHASTFGWGRTAEETRAVYADAVARRLVADSPASVVGL